jgi:hypothetical protein
MSEEDEDKVIVNDPILANKINRFDSEFKFNEEEDMSGDATEAEDPFTADGDDEFSGGFQAQGDEDFESKAGEIN